MATLKLKLAKEVKFSWKYFDNVDDSFEYWIPDRMVDREAFVECLKNGAVWRVEEGLRPFWAWNVEKAAPILKKYGYKVYISGKEV